MRRRSSVSQAIAESSGYALTFRCDFRERRFTKPV
jgi:hypothetical protein